jgi:hypothetical protein
MDTGEWKDLDEFLFARAMEHDSPKLLFRLACEYLLSSRVIRPGVILLLRRVAAARAHARTETWARVRHLLSDRPCRFGPSVGPGRLSRPDSAGLAGCGPDVVEPGRGKGGVGEAGLPAAPRRAHRGPVDAACGETSVPGRRGPPVDRAGVAAARAGTPVPDPADAAVAVGRRRARRDAAAVRPGDQRPGVRGEAEGRRGPGRAGQGRREPAGAAGRDPDHRARHRDRRRADPSRTPARERCGAGTTSSRPSRCGA